MLTIKSHFQSGHAKPLSNPQVITADSFSGIVEKLTPLYKLLKHTHHNVFLYVDESNAHSPVEVQLALQRELEETTNHVSTKHFKA